MKVIPRNQWTERKVRLSSIPRPVRDTWVHHTADNGPPGGARATVAQEKAYLRSVEAFHIGSRGMSAVAYSFLIMPSGRVYEGRGWAKAGGHTYGRNSTSHGICFAGNFQTQRPTKAALEACRQLLNQGVERGHIRKPRGSHPTGGHRDAGAEGGGTACPGENLYRQLRDLRRASKPVRRRKHRAHA